MAIDAVIFRGGGAVLVVVGVGVGGGDFAEDEEARRVVALVLDVRGQDVEPVHLGGQSACDGRGVTVGRLVHFQGGEGRRAHVDSFGGLQVLLGEEGRALAPDLRVGQDLGDGLGRIGVLSVDEGLSRRFVAVAVDGRGFLDEQIVVHGEVILPTHRYVGVAVVTVSEQIEKLDNGPI